MHKLAPYYYILENIEGFGKVTIRKILEKVGSVETLFDSPESLNELSPQARGKLVAAKNDKKLWKETTALLRQIEDREGIEIICIDDEHYPKSLLGCADAPLILFLRGKKNLLNSPHLISIVGTRNASSYGRFAVAKLVETFAEKVPDIVIVSGLAMGIDIAAHRAALELNLGTIAVMAYGHHFIYPQEHRKEYLQMQEKGLLLSEYIPSTPIERHRFVARNRIVAGLSSATVVIESALKGGALLTASMAIDYDRDLFALPGRITDRYSMGCNRLIADLKAQPFTSAEDIIEALGWGEPISSMHQTSLIESQELPDDPILQIIAREEAILFNDLLLKTNLRSSELSSKLFDLELDGYIESLPGGRYTLAFR